MGNQCVLCPTLKDRKRIVWGEEFTSDPSRPPQVLVISEAPGFDEDSSGRPLVGNSGQEARHHLTINGVTSRGCYLDSLVKCHPPENREPSAGEIRHCTEAYLIPKILELRPRWVISMGRSSTQFFLGDVNMEMVHGVPRPVKLRGHSFTLIPSFHPAAGLHDPNQMILFQRDLQVAGGVIRGEITPFPPEDSWSGSEFYHQVESPEEVTSLLSEANVVAVDTEWARGKPFCLSFSPYPGAAWVIKADQRAALDAFNAVLRVRRATDGHPRVTTVIHNALYDLPVLAEMGVWPLLTADTMVMAYLLQDEPQGLKPLAFRHCGMEMNAYSDMVGEATEIEARRYLEEAAGIDWPDPPMVLEWAKGEPKTRQPQNIKRKIARLLKRGTELFKGWKQMADTGQVEGVLGPMIEGDLSDIPWADALRYSARDADATIRVYPILWERTKGLGLEDTFWRDMSALPMVVDMMANGMPVDVVAFEDLSLYLQNKMNEVQGKIEAMVGPHLKGKAANPGSYQQMSELIYDELKLHEIGGKFKSKKSATAKSTSNDVIKRYLGIHPVIEEIISWREYQKLKSSYADSIPRIVGEDGRVRTTLRITRTVTGRLSSSSPNLMAQPTRSAEGRKVRDCYCAPEGHVFLSGDYSQVEMRVAADGAKDEKMMGIFWRGEDIHAITASEMFGIPVEQLDEMKHRYPAKRVGFGILNLITAEGLQRELAVGGAAGWSVSDCEQMIKAWFAIYSGVAAYMKASGEEAKRTGYVRDMWGRVRWIPGIRSINRWARIEAERQAGNAPIQMGAQGVIKEAMGRLVPVYRSYAEKLLPLIQIHDDIVWQVREDILSEVKPKIKRVMESSAPGDFIVPLEVDFKSGRRWGSMAKG